MKILITREIPKIAELLLLAEGYELIINREDNAIDRMDLLNSLEDVDAVIPLLTEQIDKEAIDKMKQCKVIANYAVGFNNIDVEYAASKNIIVTNTPDVLTESTAEIAVSLMLNCARRIPESINYLLEDKYTIWKPKVLLGMELKNKTLGIIGAGRIGYETAKRAKSFGMNIIYFDKNKNLKFDSELDATFFELEELLKCSDVISLHLPLNDKTHHFMDEEFLSKMKDGSLLINTSRGEIINEKSLIKFLKLGKFRGVGLDVFENEPKLNKELLQFDNVIIYPHIGSATEEARSGMAELAAKNVIEVLNGKTPLTEVKI